MSRVFSFVLCTFWIQDERLVAHHVRHAVEKDTTMKRQAGLTIIKLMVLLLIAGIVGSLAINALIRHRCLADPAAHICAEKAALDEHHMTPLLSGITPLPRSPA